MIKKRAKVLCLFAQHSDSKSYFGQLPKELLTFILSFVNLLPVGELIAIWKGEELGFNHPTAIEYDSLNKRLLIGDSDLLVKAFDIVTKKQLFCFGGNADTPRSTPGFKYSGNPKSFFNNAPSAIKFDSNAKTIAITDRSKLIKIFGALGSFQTAFTSTDPYPKFSKLSIDVVKGKLYAVDSGNGHIIVFANRSGNVIQTFQSHGRSGPFTFSTIMGIACKNNELVVAEGYQNFIIILTGQGDRIRKFSNEELLHCVCGITLGYDDKIFTISAVGICMWDKEGKLLKRFAEGIEFKDIAVDDDGIIYVINENAIHLYH